MSNIKEVIIEGKLPYDYGNDPRIAEWVGILNGPSIGLHFRWSSQQYWPNFSGGSTSMHDYSITGREAVRDEWVERLIRDLSKQGPVSKALVRDVENNTGWHNLFRWATQDWRKNFKFP